MSHKTSDPSDTPAAPDVGELLKADAELIRAWDRFEFNGPAPAQLDYKAVAGRLDQAATALASSAVETARLREERDELRLAICGGEDAPGYNASLPHETILKVLRDSQLTAQRDAELAWDCETANSWKARAQAAEAEKEAMRVEREAWAWLAERINLSLEFYFPDEDGEPGEWVVHRVSGNINDREWESVSTGITPLEAVRAAMASAEAKPVLSLKEGKDE